VRMELRSPDPTVNPYLAFALVISAGLYGIENNLSLPESLNVDLYNIDKSISDRLIRLPENLGDAIKLAEQSELVKNTLPEEVISSFLNLKKKEHKAYCEAGDKREYFLINYFREV